MTGLGVPREDSLQTPGPATDTRHPSHLELSGRARVSSLPPCTRLGNSCQWPDWLSGKLLSGLLRVTQYLPEQCAHRGHLPPSEHGNRHHWRGLCLPQPGGRPEGACGGGLPLNTWPTTQACPGCEPPLLLRPLLLDFPAAAPDRKAAEAGRGTGGPGSPLSSCASSFTVQGTHEGLWQAGHSRHLCCLPVPLVGGWARGHPPTKGWHSLLWNEVLGTVPPTFWPRRAFLLSTCLECAFCP